VGTCEHVPAWPGGQLTATLGHFIAIHTHMLGRADANPDAVSLDVRHREADVRPDHDLLSDASCENQHERRSLTYDNLAQA
jgi:hypothetical protein